MTQKQQQFDKKTREDQTQISWASQGQQVSKDQASAQSIVQKLSPQQLKYLKEHHNDVVERFQNAVSTHTQAPAPLPKQPAVNHWPVVAAKPFEATPSAALWTSTPQVCVAPAASGKDSILSSFGQRKPPTASAPSLQSFLNGQRTQLVPLLCYV
jgi:hypothetical protein